MILSKELSNISHIFENCLKLKEINNNSNLDDIKNNLIIYQYNSY